MTDSNPEASDANIYDFFVTATFAGEDDNATDPSIYKATTLGGENKATLSSGSKTLIATSTAHAAVDFRVSIWLDGTVVSSYEVGTFNVSFEVALHA